MNFFGWKMFERNQEEKWVRALARAVRARASRHNCENLSDNKIFSQN